ncbi:MAG: phosphoribosyl-ATP diphosphatase [Rhabdaerophilum sp.]
MSQFTLDELASIIASRAEADPSVSHTAKLMQRGMGVATKKFGEEAVETIIAALSGNREELIKETADVLFHLLVVLHMADVPLNEVLEELGSRTGQSGIAEKAARQPE